MRAYLLSILLLVAVAFSFATSLEPWFQTWEGGRTRADNVIQVALGDSRQLFARHFFLKADAYFHNGYYPSIYDRKDIPSSGAGAGQGPAHIAGPATGAGHGDEDEKEIDFLGPPRDWIDAFSRNFFPSRHTHLGDSGCGHSCCQRAHGTTEGAGSKSAATAKDDHDHDHDHAHAPGEVCNHDHEHDHDHAAEVGRRAADEREILPWLKLALEMDPKRVQTYVVASYWLRTTLKQPDQAERLLRDGLRQVPGDPEMLFELGRILTEERSDPERARNVWALALKNWDEREAKRKEPNFFLVAQILGNLATLEQKAGRPEPALRYLRLLSAISPNKESIEKWMQAVRDGKK